MHRVTVLATQPAAADYAPFVHGGTTYAFEYLTAGGPRRLVEGGGWAFVDWIIPELSGLELCRRLRADARTAGAHITMVLEQDDANDRRRAIKAGADDYMVGPVDRAQILDRILALSGSHVPAEDRNLVQFGDLRLDLAAVQAKWGRSPIPLSDKGFRLLLFLVQNPRRVVRREEIMDALGTGGDPDCIRTVDVWIKRLRTAMYAAGAKQLLRTVKGKGYVLDDPSF
jgi:two-component system phosphate regulon response regulator PhoB